MPTAACAQRPSPRTFHGAQSHPGSGAFARRACGQAHLDLRPRTEGEPAALFPHPRPPLSPVPNSPFPSHQPSLCLHTDTPPPPAANYIWHSLLFLGFLSSKMPPLTPSTPNPGRVATLGSRPGFLTGLTGAEFSPPDETLTQQSGGWEQMSPKWTTAMKA